MEENNESPQPKQVASDKVLAFHMTDEPWDRRLDLVDGDTLTGLGCFF